MVSDLNAFRTTGPGPNFNDLLSDLSVSWDGMLVVTGDINVDLLRLDKPETLKYKDVLDSLNLDQLVTKPTRTATHSATLKLII